MKKLLLCLSFSAVVFSAKAQTVLNEVYTDPNSGKHEFFELYNSSTIGAQNVDCFTILSLFNEGGNYGWYVVDLPNMMVASKGYFVGASASPFNVQSQTGVTANFNWNAPAAGGSLKKYINDGGPLNGYTDATGTIPANFNDIFQPINGIGAKYTILVYVNGVLNNGLTGQDGSGTIPAPVIALPNLPVTMIGCSNFNAVFSGLTVVEGAQPAVGTDNGYIRTRDGLCGSWDKSSSAVNHTPGVTNGSATGLTGSLTTAQNIACNTAPGVSELRYNISGVTGDASVAADFPVIVQVYRDLAPVGTLTGTDVILGTQSVVDISQGQQVFVFPQTYNLIVVYQTKRGCFDKVVSLINGCIALPANFKSFTAIRTNRTNVVARWETLTEQNSAGFAVERNINGSWEQVAFVPTQANGGNSNSLLTYQVNDLNTAKGISQYRIRQVDIDGVAKLSEIRSVRGEGQRAATIVYPNPSIDGKVNVVFEGEMAKRNVTVQDMSGRIVKQWNNYTNNNIQIENLTPGFYTIRVVNTETGEQTVEKAVVNKR